MTVPSCTHAREFQESEKIDFSQQGKVPVIVDKNKRGKWVNDSWAIAKYLDATYPDRPSLLGGNTGAWWWLYFDVFEYQSPAGDAAAKWSLQCMEQSVQNKQEVLRCHCMYTAACRQGRQTRCSSSSAWSNQYLQEVLE